MPSPSPAAGRANGALVLLTAALVAGGLLACFDGGAPAQVGPVEAFEQDQEAIVAELQALLTADLIEHLPVERPWGAELSDGAHLERVIAEHWSELILPGAEEAAYCVRADSFVDPIDEEPGPFAQALPGVRVIDLSVKLVADGETTHAEIQSAGARLDDLATQVLRDSFENRGLAVRVAALRIGR